ncbi:MAG: amino acid--tRNA ligase-related protein, partial [Ignisphaera sp.]
FDLIWQHLELASGSSRIHVKEMFIEALKSRGLNPDNFQYFIKWFDYGMPPHAGWGLGLARFLLLLTGRTNVKEVTLFPRDKKRLSP